MLITKNALKESNICHYWYFLDKIVKYEPYLCNGCHDLMLKAMNFNDVAIVSIKGCHDLMLKAMNFNDVAIVSIKGSDYRIYIWYTSKDDAISRMSDSNLNEISGSL